MRKILLKSRLGEKRYTLVDDDDFNYLNQFSWHIGKSRGGRAFYVIRQDKVNNKKHIVRLHRLIMNCPEHLFVDHINGNTLDNRKSNLRLCTPRQNSRNRKLGRDNTSGYKGVSFQKDKKKWRAGLTINGVWTTLGLYNDKISAARAYNDAAIRHFGEYARLNVI